jgi:hypothetical protein
MAASARIAHFQRAIEQLFNGHLDVFNDHLEESIALICTVMVMAIREAEAIGGPKAEQAARAIVAFKKTAAQLVEPPTLQPAPTPAKPQKPKGRKSGAHDPRVEEMLCETWILIQDRNRALRKNIKAGKLDREKADIVSIRDFAKFIIKRRPSNLKYVTGMPLKRDVNTDPTDDNIVLEDSLIRKIRRGLKRRKKPAPTP